MLLNTRKIYLFLAGSILSLVGLYIGLMPTDYLSQFFIETDINVAVLSEMRGMGGNLLVFGIFILGGAFLKRLERVTMIISCLIFASFSLFRALGIILDGMPGQSILLALIIEVIFALLAIPLLRRPKTSGLDSIATQD
ncbi:MAG: DUF4345 domain-containing protein [Alteromonadaceae bacterium]|nr:DUF4345 domain-containing protein [Alteromonadaceae bacterium]